MRYLPQNRFIPKNLTIKQVFEYFDLKFEDLLLHFPVFEKYLNFKIGSLSGGEIRIIEVFVILKSKTKFCLLDEPFSQVMPLHVEVLKKLILLEKEHKGIIMTDHMYQSVIDVSDDIYVLSSGSIYLTKNTHDLIKHGYINRPIN